MTKKIINDPRSVVDETLEGFLAAHGEHYEKLPDVRGICMKQKKDRRRLSSAAEAVMSRCSHFSSGTDLQTRRPAAIFSPPRIPIPFFALPRRLTRAKAFFLFMEITPETI